MQLGDKQLCKLVFLLLLAHFSSAESKVTVDTCRGYPELDPCLPGGVWDPVLDR